MKLDNEEQRKLLITIIDGTTINGNYLSALQAIEMLSKLKQVITNAKIETITPTATKIG